LCERISRVVVLVDLQPAGGSRRGIPPSVESQGVGGFESGREPSAKHGPEPVFRQAGLPRCPPFCQNAPAQGGAIIRAAQRPQWEGDLIRARARPAPAAGPSGDLKPELEGAPLKAPPATQLPRNCCGGARSCFSMALLARAGAGWTRSPSVWTPPAPFEFGPKQGGGFEVKSSSLEVRGQVPGIDQGRVPEGGRGCETGARSRPPSDPDERQSDAPINRLKASSLSRSGADSVPRVLGRVLRVGPLGAWNRRVPAASPPRGWARSPPSRRRRASWRLQPYS